MEEQAMLCVSLPPIRETETSLGLPVEMTGLLSHLKKIKSRLSVCFFSRFLSTALLCRFKKQCLSKMLICFTLIRLLFRRTFWWTTHECFSEKNTLIDMVWWKHLTWLVAYVPLALWLYPHIQHFILLSQHTVWNKTTCTWML